MRLRLALVLCTAASICCAQPYRPLPSHAVYGKLLQLRTLASVLYVAAHPDDENTRLLSWLATGKHVRTAYLSITRGDGGQNIIGGEQGAALGLIRTYELLEARKLDGAGQFFASAIDFGFSKNPGETFRQWDSLALVSDVLRTYRRFRPDVVICRFPKDSMAGHGQHSASAILAESAYDVLVRAGGWTPTRLLFNAFRFGNRSTVRDGMFRLDVGQYDPLIGMGYGELAGISRSIHRSQGAGTPSVPGVQPEFFATLRGTAPSKSLFDGIDTLWTRVGRPDIGFALDSAIAAFSMSHPEKSVPALLRVRDMIKTVADEHWRSIKLEEIESVILACIGLNAEVTTAATKALTNDTLKTTLRITARAGVPTKMLRAVWPDGAYRENVELPNDSLVSVDVTTRVPENTRVSQPYWLEIDSPDARFRYPEDVAYSQQDLPAQLPDYRVQLTISIDQHEITIALPISTKRLDPLRGDVTEALRIVPPVSVEPVHVVEFSSSTQIRIRAFARIQNATLLLRNTKGVEVRKEGISINANTDTLITMALPPGSTHMVHAELFVSGTPYGRFVRQIQYDHLPTLQYTTPAVIRLPDERGVRIAAKRIAYVVGAGEFAPDFLRGLGVVVDEIDDATILRTDELLKYDAVLVGIRAINTRKSMLYLMPSLMTYVERGGTLVMQYNTLQDMSTKLLGPYPLALANKRVTEEESTVTILEPNHPLLTTPNRIGAEDFVGWVQEYGLYFPVEFDSRYTPLLSMHDANEAPLNGSLLYTRYGKGHYISCSLSLFRQLPAGVSGAMRLFANLLSVK